MSTLLHYSATIVMTTLGTSLAGGLLLRLKNYLNFQDMLDDSSIDRVAVEGYPNVTFYELGKVPLHHVKHALPFSKEVILSKWQKHNKFEVQKYGLLATRSQIPLLFSHGISVLLGSFFTCLLLHLSGISQMRLPPLLIGVTIMSVVLSQLQLLRKLDIEKQALRNVTPDEIRSLISFVPQPGKRISEQNWFLRRRHEQFHQALNQ